jgi:hypothetical protein
LGSITATWRRPSLCVSNARGGRVIADVVRLDKGHTKGLEPRITEELIRMVVAAPGGKAQQIR